MKDIISQLSIMYNIPSPESQELMKLLGWVDIEGVVSVKFLSRNGGFIVKTLNMRRLAVYFTEKYGKTQFAGWELWQDFEFVAQHIESSLSQRDIDLIKWKVREFVRDGGEVHILRKATHVSQWQSTPLHLKLLKYGVYGMALPIGLFIAGNYIITLGSYRHIIGDIYANTYNGNVIFAHEYTILLKKPYTVKLPIIGWVDAKTFSYVWGWDFTNTWEISLVWFFKDKNHVYSISTSVGNPYTGKQGEAHGDILDGIDPNSFSIIDENTVRDINGIHPLSRTEQWIHVDTIYFPE